MLRSAAPGGLSLRSQNVPLGRYVHSRDNGARVALCHGAELCYAPMLCVGMLLFLLVVVGEMIIFENVGVGWGLPHLFLPIFRPEFRI